MGNLLVQQQVSRGFASSRKQENLLSMPAKIQNFLGNPRRSLIKSAVTGDQLRELFHRIDSVSSDEDLYDEDFVKPTPSAISYTKSLLTLVDASAHKLIRAAAIYPDGAGGLRAEWKNGTRQLRLVVHNSVRTKTYLYHQDGKEYDVIHPVTPQDLTAQLEWLVKNAQ